MRVHSQRGTLIAVGVIIAGGIVAGLLLGRREAEAVVPATQTAVAVASAAKPASASSTTNGETPTAAPPISTAALAKLAQDSMAGPRDRRLAAIRELSRAPKAQALPLLKQVMLNGEPGVDRPAALSGLRDLALAQGDGDERIRDAVREVIYHGDDEALATAAQETIDVISRAN